MSVGLARRGRRCPPRAQRPRVGSEAQARRRCLGRASARRRLSRRRLARAQSRAARSPRPGCRA
eukprot:14103007-Alexandrium_andersonii.AAC.1